MKKTGIVIAILSGIVGCKVKQVDASLSADDGYQETTVHGMPMSVQKRQEILLALGGSNPPSSLGSNDSQYASNQQSQGSDLGYADNGYANDGYASQTNDPSGYQDPYFDDTQNGTNGLSLLAAGDTPYMLKCRSKNVPIPPAWGDPKWVSKGELPASRIFALSNALKTEIFVYKSNSPAGTCAALPRTDKKSGFIFALGIICQGASGNACFWDNVDPSSGRKVSKPSAIRPELIGDGSNLRENCTGCHRGGNVFIVHTDTNLDNIPNRDIDRPYSPISGQPDWGNPQASAGLAKTCASECHYTDYAGTLGKLEMGYCSTILLPSITGNFLVRQPDGTQKLELGTPTMPPAGEDRSKFSADIAQIKAACKKIWDARNPPSKPFPWK